MRATREARRVAAPPSRGCRIRVQMTEDERRLKGIGVWGAGWVGGWLPMGLPQRLQ